MAQHVSSAHLADAMGQSELQVDVKSDSWGPVSVHAILSSGQVGAEIQVSDRDAHAALTEGLLTLEKALGDKGIQVAHLDVSQGLGYSHAQSQGQQEGQSGQLYRAAKIYTPRLAIKTETPTVSTITNGTEDFVSNRVSVRV
jgi:flagellar hook-length control protein FliK